MAIWLLSSLEDLSPISLLPVVVYVLFEVGQFTWMAHSKFDLNNALYRG